MTAAPDAEAGRPRRRRRSGAVDLDPRPAPRAEGLAAYAIASYNKGVGYPKATAFRLTPQEVLLMDLLAAKVGVTSRADVLRVAIRKLAGIEGVDVPKAPAKKRRAPQSAA